MTKVQAAVGLTQLAKIDRVIAGRLEKSLKLISHLKDVDEIILPVDMNDEHVCHLFVIQLDLEKLNCDRDIFREKLQKNYGVGTGIHYPAVWNWEAAEQFDYDNSDCPITERMCKSVITLPVFANTPDEDAKYIAWSIKQLIGEVKK